MPAVPDRQPQPKRYQGFSLQDVCWGYRDIFKQIIEELFSQGLLGSNNEKVTDKFFELMRHSDECGFDHVLKEFLGALNQSTRWIMDLPGVFTEIVELGREFAESRKYYGVSYFRTLGEGGFGRTPAEVRNLMDHLRRLRGIDEDLAFSFLKGYGKLVERLAPDELKLYVEDGVKVFTNNRKSGLAFMEGTLKSCESLIQVLSRECRLQDIKPRLESLLQALVGYKVEVADLGSLDSDELIERNTRMVCMYQWLYLPRSLGHFDTAHQNRNWFLLLGVVAAGMLAENSFCRIHGLPGYRTCRNLVGDDVLSCNLFQIIEYVRVIQTIKRRWPGASNLLEFGLSTEFKELPPHTSADRLLYDALAPSVPSVPAVEAVRSLADSSVNTFDTTNLVQEGCKQKILADFPGLDRYPLRTVSFLPDFFYPGEVSAPPSDKLVADLKQAAKEKRKKSDETESDKNSALSVSDENQGDRYGKEEEGSSTQETVACYVYDEWSQEENDYYRDYCQVYERFPKDVEYHLNSLEMPADLHQIRRIFELLKPDLVRREKYLTEGDSINHDLLVEYLVQHREEPYEEPKFYEKPRITQRQIAVLLLLDVSGSTADDVDQGKVLDIEKQAAFVLSEGLTLLGDTFAVCGFSGNGREKCEYYVYKDFSDTWNDEGKHRVLCARPLSSTRMGPAIRHSGFRLSQVEAKQRLILLMTDGKPMDKEYDPNTRYAQYDVHVACEENKRQNIHTFCISTEENSRADMEIMFPDRGFVILSDIRQLPRVLPRLYIKMTR